MSKGEVHVWNDGAIWFNEADDWHPDADDGGSCLLTIRGGKDHDLDAKTMREFGEALIKSADLLESAKDNV